MKLKPFPKSSFKKLLFLILIFSLGVLFGVKNVANIQSRFLTSIEKNTPGAFVSEVYDKIKENYWDKISDAELLDLFKLSIDKSGGNLMIAKFTDKNQLLSSVVNITSSMDNEKKNKFTTNVVAAVLMSLNPAGRSALYTQASEQQLKNTVNNVNPEKDLYKDLGLQKGASEAAVAAAYKKLASSASGEKLKQITYAKDTLTQPQAKQNYDQNQVEPTIFTKITAPGVLYLQFKKFSPTTLDEFQRAFETYKNDSTLNGLILDLRDNVGGAIDATAYFLGFFLGKNQYAFDFYHKGDFLPFKTPTDKLLSLTKYKQVVILVNNQTQSSAEMMAAALKKYHVGVVVGTATKGWGTVEKVFPLDNQIDKNTKYSLFLVHSITLRDDNLPIEGRGVDPDINIKDSDWPQKMLLYFNNPTLVETVKETLSKP